MKRFIHGIALFLTFISIASRKRFDEAGLLFTLTLAKRAYQRILNTIAILVKRNRYSKTNTPREKDTKMNPKRGPITPDHKLH
eukprot:g34949.t1